MESLVASFAQDITRHRRHAYSHELLEQYLLTHGEVGCCTLRVPNQSQSLLETMLLKGKHNSSCIIYAHGLGSNKLEALPVARMFLREGYDVCSFDFSGGGRSEGEHTTFGLNEKDDLNSILAHLQSSQSYRKYILWGRSMGAVAIALFQGAQKHRKVCGLVLDSPFSSFEQVAVEIAAKKSLIPQFMLSLLIEPLKTYFATSSPVDPFSTDIPGSISAITCRVMLIYSPNDSIVDHRHSLELARHCNRPPTTLVISEDHNKQRSKNTLRQILSFVTDANSETSRRPLSRNRARGISVASKEGRDRDNVSVSVRSQSKIKLASTPSDCTIGAKQGIARSVGPLGDMVNGLARSATEQSPLKRRRTAGITSMCLQGRVCNKQNIKPSLNMLRRNRFRC